MIQQAMFLLVYILACTAMIWTALKWKADSFTDGTLIAIVLLLGVIAGQSFPKEKR